MKIGFFLKLAWSNIGKNRRFFLPRILAEAGLLSVFFIVFTLKSDERILGLRGGESIGTFMSIGVVVMTILSAILLFYTNSFLMKQRKREFGIYNILGLEKRHIGRVLFHETFLCSAIAIVLGLGCGLLFYKLCSLLICRLLHAEIVLGFDFISGLNLAISAAFFAALDLLTYLANCMNIARLKPVELLASANSGEREPKVKWPLLIIGAAALAAGYYISVTTQSPLQAISLFFLAVILVIVGTYFLFVSGSIFVLKALKRNKKFYYNPKRMPAVSGLLYRMKQNAVGLASIAILATGVLVMISTTVSLYAGMEESLDKNFPQEYYLSVSGRKQDTDEWQRLPSEIAVRAVEEAAADTGLGIQDLQVQEYLNVAYGYENDTLYTDRTDKSAANLTSITFITRDMYGKLGGVVPELAKNEIAICPMDIRDMDFDRPELTIGDYTYRVKTVMTTLFPVQMGTQSAATRCYGVVVADESVLRQIFTHQQQAYGRAASRMSQRVAVTFTDKEAACAIGPEFQSAVYKRVQETALGIWGEDMALSYNYDALWEGRANMVGMYGSLLFLGIILGLVCLFATALIVYYKQISEGYEDRGRFQIMQKVGMSRREVRSTINTQVLLVFFLPLLVAGLHLVFAFPILEKLLHILLLSSTGLFVACAAITFGVFAGVYVLIYLGTARTYYKIVQ